MPIASNVIIHYQKVSNDSDKVASRIVVKNIEISDTISLEDLVLRVIQTLRSRIQNGMCIEELYELLRTECSIAKNCICDIVERIKKELCLYSPDEKHLYFANV